MFDFIVVGGGPAGMMAAGRAGERGKRVLLLERGPALGRKLLITATGRCNVTNSAPVDDLMKAFGRQGGFLRDAFSVFNNQDLLDWLHSRGVKTVEERKGRVFPESQKAETVLNALKEYLRAGHVDVQLNQRVKALRIEAGVLHGVETENNVFHEAPNCLIATGGMSYPGTGSSGDGYTLARQAGHTIVPPWPAIVAFETSERWPARIQGTPIKNVRVIAYSGDRKIAENFGEGLWTHYGISGPVILDMSRDIVPTLGKDVPVRLELDLRPGDTEEALDERLLFSIKKEGKKQIDSVVGNWIAQRAATALLTTHEVDPRKKMCQCGKSDRRKIVRLIKHLEVHVTRPRPIEEAIVTGGGVALGEVNSKRMESRLVKGLFFAGEVLDLAGPSGGYNLQAAFSTGWLAGESV